MAYQLSEEINQQIIILQRNNQPWRHVRKIGLILLIWLTCALLATHVNALWIQLPCWFLIALCLHNLAIFSHEGAHATLSSRPGLDRNIGFFCGLMSFFPCNNYWATHRLHHRYTNTEKDPDCFDKYFKHPAVSQFLYLSWLVIGIPLYILMLLATGFFRANRPNEKLRCLSETFVFVITFCGLFYFSSTPRYVHILKNVWLYPAIMTLFIAQVRGAAEHALFDSEENNRFKSARTTLTHPIISFFFNNQNYHLEHHLFPKAPWYNLAKVHQLLKQTHHQRSSEICHGYREFLRGITHYKPAKT